MKLLSAIQAREWDEYTIANEPISSLELMERAAKACVKWLYENNYSNRSFLIFCGKGNNGGDGLAIARMLHNYGNDVTVYILEFGHKGTDDFQANLTRLHQFPQVEIHFIQDETHFPFIDNSNVVVDALFGSGLNRSIHGITEKLVEFINSSGADIISIDIPSGMLVDRSSKGFTRINASHTLSFQVTKPAFLVAENAKHTGNVHVLDIGLHYDYYEKADTRFQLIDETIIGNIYKPRNEFAHKGNFGHALLLAGSLGKMGAAILAAKACLRSGVGLLTCRVPEDEHRIIQAMVPEAMTEIAEMDLSKFNSIGIGPGIGVSETMVNEIQKILDGFRSPVVIDADALNILAANKKMLSLIPAGSILTPHPKEFERLFGEVGNEFERIEIAIQKANELSAVIIVKGHHSFVAIPGKNSVTGYFNSTGNAGMATAGSGDVLTGILTALIAQGYSSIEAAIFGVYLHGLAGDFAADKSSQEAMIASDIITELGNVFNTFRPQPLSLPPLTAFPG